MTDFVAFTFNGLFFGAAYAIAASGLVLTYTTTRVFNLSHGAISMLAAYTYWQLHVSAGLPTWLSVGLVLFVLAPLFGVVLDRAVMRRLGDAPVSVSLVVTLGVFLLLIGVATQFWPADKVYNVDQFFGYDYFSFLGARISYYYGITVLVSALVAVGLYVLLNRTRIGTAMRAAVDNRELLQLFGARADRVSMLSWALGCSLAALAGILLEAYTGLDYYTLTFLVVSASAAAMLGRLKSLPLTYAGAMALGLATGYCHDYIHTNSQLIQTGLIDALPTFMLFATLIFVPQVRLRVGQVKGILAANVPRTRQALASSAALVLVALISVPMLDVTDTLRAGTALGYGLVMLSLVLLTGYGGYVSLAQFTFVCVGAATVGKLDTGSPLAIVLAVLISAGVGALVALPVLRLTGLYLALATLAFGQLMDKLVFGADWMFGYGGSMTVKRVSILGYDFSSPRSYVFLMLAAFIVVGIGLLALRRGPVGRLLIALRDSPAACGTLGLNQRWFRVAVFSASAGIAGLAGALLGGLRELVDPRDYQTFQSLPLLLVAVVAGVTTISGALLGGVLLMLLPVIQATAPSYAGVVFLVIGFGAIMLGRDPNGLANLFYRAVRSVAPRLPLPARTLTRSPAPAVADSAALEIESLPEGQVAGHGVA